MMSSFFIFFLHRKVAGGTYIDTPRNPRYIDKDIFYKQSGISACVEDRVLYLYTLSTLIFPVGRIAQESCNDSSILPAPTLYAFLSDNFQPCNSCIAIFFHLFFTFLFSFCRVRQKPSEPRDVR